MFVLYPYNKPKNNVEASSKRKHKVHQVWPPNMYKVRYTGALLPLLLEPATWSTNVEIIGRLRRFPITGVARRAWTAMGMNGPNRLRKPITGGGGVGVGVVLKRVHI